MIGDWPETLPADVLDNPNATVDLIANYDDGDRPLEGLTTSTC